MPRVAAATAGGVSPMVAMPSMSDGVSPASAMAACDDSTVSSRASMPVLRPIRDIPMPEISAPLTPCSRLTGSRLPVGIGLEERHEDLALLLEDDTHRQADGDRLHRAVHEVGGEPQPVLLDEFDDGDHVRHGDVGMEAVVVHGVGRASCRERV